MSVSLKRRLVAVFALAAVSVIAACQGVSSTGLDAMTSAQQASALALAKWVACDTIRRVSKTSGVDSTDVEICADTGARRYGPNDPPPGIGKPVARMRNVGQGVEKRWGLTPGSHYYSVWIRGPANAIRWRIHGLQVDISGPYRGCGYHTMPSSSSANFGSCTENPPLVGRSIGRGPAENWTDGSKEHILLDRATGPAWISCTDGCCTTDAI